MSEDIDKYTNIFININMKIRKVSGIEGLYYIENAVDDDIINEIDKNEWMNISGNQKGRKVQQYGYKYDYKSRNVKEKIKDIPDFLSKCNTTLTGISKKLGIIDDDYVFNQCIINNYESGQIISKHIDSDVFGKVIGCYTVGSGGTMRFSHGDDKIDLYVAPRSLYIMTGDARYKWSHELLGKKYDDNNGTLIKRERRVSITFRNMK